VQEFGFFGAGFEGTPTAELGFKKPPSMHFGNDPRRDCS
jgi:hypothetical protein